MKKPALKRKKRPASHELAAAAPFEPVPVKAPRRGRRKAAKEQATAASLAAGALPAAAPAKRRRRLGGLGRALTAPLRLLGRPFRKLRVPRGKARIVFYAVLAVVVVAAVIVLRGGRDDQQLVRQALANYEHASQRRDYQRLCDDLFAKSYVRQTASSGLPCEVALRTALADINNPTLKVLSVEVSGDRAAARVRGSAAGQVSGDATYTLVRENDAWKILPPSGSGAGAKP